MNKAGIYFFVIFLFALGAGIGSIVTGFLGHGAIWISCALLFISFLLMFIEEKLE